MKPYVAWSITCVALCAAVAVAVYTTGSAWCLWALLFIPSVQADKR